MAFNNNSFMSWTDSPPTSAHQSSSSQAANGLNLSNRTPRQSMTTSGSGSGTGISAGQSNFASALASFGPSFRSRRGIFSELSSQLSTGITDTMSLLSSYNNGSNYGYSSRRVYDSGYHGRSSSNHHQPMYPPRRVTPTSNSASTTSDPRVPIPHVTYGDWTVCDRRFLDDDIDWVDDYHPSSPVTTRAQPRSATRAPASGSTRAPASGSTRAPASGSTRAPTSGSTRAPTSGSTRAPASGSARAPASGSTRAPASGSASTSTSAPVIARTIKTTKTGSTSYTYVLTRDSASGSASTSTSAPVIARTIKTFQAPRTTKTGSTSFTSVLTQDSASKSKAPAPPPSASSSTSALATKYNEARLSYFKGSNASKEKDTRFISDLRRLLSTYEAEKNFEISTTRSYLVHLDALHRAVDAFDADLRKSGPAVREAVPDLEMYFISFEQSFKALTNYQLVDSTSLQAAAVVEEFTHLVEATKRRLGSSSSSQTEKDLFRTKLIFSLDPLLCSITKLLNHCTSHWMRNITEDVYLYSSILEDGCEKFILSTCRLLRQIFIEEKLGDGGTLKLKTLTALLESMLPFWLLQGASGQYDEVLDGIQYYGPISDLYEHLFGFESTSFDGPHPQWPIKPAVLASALLGLVADLTVESAESMTKQSYYKVMKLYKKIDAPKANQAMLKDVWSKMSTVFEKNPPDEDDGLDIGVDGDELELVLFQLFTLFELYSDPETTVIVQDEALRTSSIATIENFLMLLASACGSTIWDYFGLIDAEIVRLERTPESVLMIAYLSSMGYDRGEQREPTKMGKRPLENSAASAVADVMDVDEPQPSTSSASAAAAVDDAAAEEEEAASSKVIDQMPEPVIIDIDDSDDSDSAESDASDSSIEKKEKKTKRKRSVEEVEEEEDDQEPSCSQSSITRARTEVATEKPVAPTSPPPTTSITAATDADDGDNADQPMVPIESSAAAESSETRETTNNEIVQQILQIQKELLTHQTSITELMKKLTDSSD